MNNQTKTALKVVINLGLIYQLIVMVIIPNNQSYLNSSLGAYLLPYANTLGLHNSWDFFAPAPQQPLFLKIDPSAADSWTYPDIPLTQWYLKGVERRLAISRMAAQHQEIMDKVFLPWLCRRYGAGTTIEVTPQSVNFPSLQQVEEGHILNDLSQRQDGPPSEMECEGKPGEAIP